MCDQTAHTDNTAETPGRKEIFHLMTHLSFIHQSYGVMTSHIMLKLKCPSTSVNKKGKIRVVFRARTGFYIPISLYRKIEPHPTLTLPYSNFTIFNTLVKGTSVLASDSRSIKWVFQKDCVQYCVGKI